MIQRQRFAKLKMLHKKMILKVLKHFFFILRWRAECPDFFSGVSRGGGGGEGGPPLSFRPKRGPKGRKNFFFETGPPRYLRIWVTAPPPPPPPPLSEGVDPPLVLLSRKEKWRLCLSESCQTFIPGRWSLQLELANIPVLLQFVIIIALCNTCRNL